MTSPVVHDGVIYIAVQSYGDATRTLKHALLEWLDTNQDKILARNETPKEFHERFDASDKNKNGLIDADEIDTAFQSPDNMAAGGNIIQAIKGGGSGDVTKTHVLWNLDHKSPSNLSSPLLFNNRLYVVKGGGMSSCYDAKDGKTLWDRTRLGNFGDYFASPVAADGKVFIAGKNGFVVVLEDGPELKVLAKNDIGEEIIATPSIADGRLYVRTRENLFCVAAGGSKATLAANAAMPTTIELTSQLVSGSRVWNGYTGNAMGQESWSEAELEMRLQQLKKLGYTTVAIPKAVAPFTPIRVDGDTGGRKAFRGAKTFENPDVATITARFREKAATLGFEVVTAEPVEASVLPKNDFADEKALSDLVTPMCGEGVAERMWLGFQAIDKAAQLIAQNDPKLGIPAPDMLLRHLNSKGAPPAWLTEVKTLYTTAMNEMYRANTRARQRLVHARVANHSPTMAGQFAQADQADTKQQPKHYPHCGGEQATVDRVLHHQHGRDDQRQATSPDRQLAAEQFLEPHAGRSLPDRLWFDRLRFSRERQWSRSDHLLGHLGREVRFWVNR
jgi:outer membrane protein assembly factor BamB